MEKPPGLIGQVSRAPEGRRTLIDPAPFRGAVVLLKIGSGGFTTG